MTEPFKPGNITEHDFVLVFRHMLKLIEENEILKRKLEKLEEDK